MRKFLACAALAAAATFAFTAPSAEAAKCDRGPDYTYIGNNPQECLTLHFFCAEGVRFDNACGCGCYTGA
jgi:hypothetical protein